MVAFAAWKRRGEEILFRTGVIRRGVQRRVGAHPAQRQHQVDVDRLIVVGFADDALAQAQGLDLEPVGFGAVGRVFENDKVVQ